MAKRRKNYRELQHMIRVCHIITGLYTGGAEMMLYKLLSGMDRSRFEPSVISLIDRGALGARIEALGVPVHSLNMPRGRPTVAGLARLFRLLREMRPDVIQGWLYHGNLAASLVGMLPGGRWPVVWGIHHSVQNLQRERPGTRAIIRLSRALSRRPVATVYVSRASAAQHAALGFRDRQPVVIPNGFDGALFRPDSQARQAFRASIGAGADEVLIGLMARFHPMKDHGNLLRATRLLGGVRLVLAGPGIDSANPDLQRMIEAEGVADRTTLLGERGDMARIMAGLDILCMSSSHGEAFPMAVGEAMASGVPCVVTDVGDAAWLVGDTGRVVPPCDSDALAGALQAMIDAGPDGRQALGEAARARVLQHFSLDATVGAYQDLYRAVPSPFGRGLG